MTNLEKYFFLDKEIDKLMKAPKTDIEILKADAMIEVKQKVYKMMLDEEILAVWERINSLE